MSLSRRNPRRDANEAEIIHALEAIGVIVRRVSSWGVPDLLTFYRGRWLPIEVKHKDGKLTGAQETLYEFAPFPIVETVEEALASVEDGA